MKTNLIILIASIVILSSCSMRKIVTKRLQTRMPISDLDNRKIDADIEYYRRMVERITPYPYLFAKKTKIDSVSAKIKSKKSLSATTFYEQFLTLQGSYNVPHMYSDIPRKQYEQYAKANGLFPAKCTIVNDTLVVLSTQISNNILNKGDRILSINDMDADSLFKAFYRYEGGLLEQKKSEVSRRFEIYLWLNGVNAPFQIVSLNGSTRSIVNVEGYKPDNRVKKSPNAEKSRGINEFISYKVVHDTIAYIDFKSMSGVDNDKFTDFLASTFSDIKKRNIAILLVDLRNNMGGNSRYGSKLIECFASKPYRMTSSKKWLVSQEYKDSFKKMAPWYIRFLAVRLGGRKEYFDHGNGVFYKYENAGSLTAPKPDEERFNGDVYVLIGNKTFSSAMMTANAIEDFDLAVLVGEPTGDSPNHLGEIVPIRLPNSGISCWLPSALFVRANGDHENTDPVTPDIEIDNVDNLDLDDIISKLFRQYKENH